MVERGKPYMAIWRKCIACWVPKATHTHTLTHTNSMQYLMLFHYNNGCTNAPPCNVCTNIACLVFITLRSDVRGDGNLSCAAAVRDVLIDVAK
jgi:hypothetical protein